MRCKETGIKECFEQLMQNRAEHMAENSSLKEQAIALGVNIDSDNELKVFKKGRWDAMIFDSAQALNLVAYARRDFRKRLIQEWQSEGL